MTELPTWVADPALASFWDRVQVRFANAGLVPQGRVKVGLTSRDERRAVGDLLGRTVTRPSVVVDLAELDTRLRHRSGVGGIGGVLSCLGMTPEDRPALRAAQVESRERPLALAAQLVSAPWSAEWVSGLRRSGLLTNKTDAEAAVRDAASVLLDLTALTDLAAGEGLPHPQSRVELGARVLGDAHALDRDRLVHQVVLRGLAAARGVDPPTTTPDREELWSQFGVAPDLLSRTCLVWGLPVDGGSAVGRRLAVAAQSGDPIHVTEWDLRRAGRLTPRRRVRVLVCENPRVLEAVAEVGVTGWAAVCTSGEPNLVVGRVLGDLAAAGADLRYHGDFDWAGVAIANRVVSRYGVLPWRMSASDYLEGVRIESPPLLGGVVEPGWDAELGAAMRGRGRAVHEESVLVGLIEAMRSA